MFGLAALLVAGVGASMSPLQQLLDLYSARLSIPSQLSDHLSAFAHIKSEDLPPIIFTSGLTASNLTVSVHKFPFCLKLEQDTPIQFWPFGDDTLKDLGTMCILLANKVHYDATSGTYSDPHGVEVDIQDFGGVDGLTFANFIVEPMKPLGYQLGVNLFGAPFDWRHSDLGHGEKYFPRMKALCERIFEQTGKKASIFAPSYGPQNVLGFLQRMTQEWKDTYIAWFIAVSPVWSGTVGVLPYLLSTPLSAFIHETPSVYWLMPMPGNQSAEWGAHEVLIQTPSKNYTALDIPTLLTDAGLHEKVPMYKDLLTRGVLAKFDPPGVDTFVTYGTGLDTPGSVLYEVDLVPNKFKPVNFSVVFNITEKGDGVVPLRSSIRSRIWEGRKNDTKKLIHKEYYLQPHAGCIGVSSACFADVLGLIINGTIPTPR